MALTITCILIALVVAGAALCIHGLNKESQYWKDVAEQNRATIGYMQRERAFLLQQIRTLEESKPKPGGCCKCHGKS